MGYSAKISSVTKWHWWRIGGMNIITFNQLLQTKNPSELIQGRAYMLHRGICIALSYLSANRLEFIKLLYVVPDGMIFEQSIAYTKLELEANNTSCLFEQKVNEFITKCQLETIDRIKAFA